MKVNAYNAHPMQTYPTNSSATDSRIDFRLIALVGMVLASQSTHATNFDCLIEPRQVVEITSPVTGLLESVSVRRGDRVKKGQVVATLESKAERSAAELAKFKSEALGPTQNAQNKINFAEKKYNRIKSMADESLSTLQERDDAEAELRLAQSELVIANENRQQGKLEYQQQSSLLNLRSIKSPIDGVVVEQTLNAGEMADPTSAKKAILKLAQLDPLRVNVIIPSAMFGTIKPGMAVNVVPELPLGASAYKSTVHNVDKLINGASGTFAVYLDLPNKDLAIAAGVRCKATFPASVAVGGK